MAKLTPILIVTSLLALHQPAAAGTLPVGVAAEAFRIKTVNSEVVQARLFSLGQLVGPSAKESKKLVILSFFATYCEPCKRELPLLQKLFAEYGDQGLGVLVVSIDKDGDIRGGAAKAVAEIAEQNGLTFPVLHDRFNIVAKRYGVEKLPCLYLIDQQGNIALVNVGYTDDFSAQLVTEVQTRLGQPVGARKPPPHPARR